MGHASAWSRIKNDVFFLLGCLCTGHFSSQADDRAAVCTARPAGAPPITFPWRSPRGPVFPVWVLAGSCTGHVLPSACLWASLPLPLVEPSLPQSPEKGHRP